MKNRFFKITFMLNANQVVGIRKYNPRLPIRPNVLLTGYHDAMARSDADSISVRLEPSEKSPIFPVLRDSVK